MKIGYRVVPIFLCGAIGQLLLSSDSFSYILGILGYLSFFILAIILNTCFDKLKEINKPRK